MLTQDHTGQDCVHVNTEFNYSKYPVLLSLSKHNMTAHSALPAGKVNNVLFNTWSIQQLKSETGAGDNQHRVKRRVISGFKSFM